MADRPEARIDTADRERASAALDTHYAAGRLSTAELSERRAAVATSTTRADLVAIFADLPETTPPPARPTAASRERSPLPAILLAIVAVAVGLAGGGWWWLLLVPASGLLLLRWPMMRQRRR